MKCIGRTLVAPLPAAATTKAQFNRQREKWANFEDRFAWGLLCVWTDLSELDFDELVRLKDISECIAHGSLATPSPDAVEAVERLTGCSRRHLPQRALKLGSLNLSWCAQNLQRLALQIIGPKGKSACRRPQSSPPSPNPPTGAAAWHATCASGGRWRRLGRLMTCGLSASPR